MSRNGEENLDESSNPGVEWYHLWEKPEKRHDYFISTEQTGVSSNSISTLIDSCEDHKTQKKSLESYKISYEELSCMIGGRTNLCGLIESEIQGWRIVDLYSIQEKGNGDCNETFISILAVY